MVKEALSVTAAKKNMCDIILSLEDIEAASVIAELAEVKAISQNSCKTATKYNIDQESDDLSPSTWDHEASSAVQSATGLEELSEKHRKGHFEKKYAGAFKKCIAFLKDLKCIEFGVEPAELPKLNPNCPEVQVKNLRHQHFGGEFPPNAQQNLGYPVFFPGPLPVGTENVASTDGNNNVNFFYKKNLGTGDVDVVPFVTIAGDCRMNDNISLLSLTPPAYIVYNSMSSCKADRMSYHLSYDQCSGMPCLTSELLCMSCSDSKEGFPAGTKSADVTGVELASPERTLGKGTGVPSPNRTGKHVESTLKGDKERAKGRSSSGNKQEVQHDLINKTSLLKESAKTIEATASYMIQRKRLYEEQKNGTSQHEAEDSMSMDESSTSSVRTSNSTNRPAKKTRLTVSVEERDILEKFYNQNQYPSRHRYNEIRKIMGWSSSRRITKWFNNRRYNTKQKRKS